MPLLSKKKAVSSQLLFEARSLVRRIQTLAHREALWQKNERILVGVSGGPDSSCLLDILAYLAPKYDWQLHVVHVNYRLRGAQSDRDERFVRRLAQSYGLSCTVFRPTVPRSGNMEEALRDIRYRRFESLKERKGFSLIAVGHNADDQAETLLLRLVRGSGLQGLSSMRTRNGSLIRPLLETSRGDILAYLAQQKLAFREDASNLDKSILRNRIRHGLLPYLEANYEPTIKKILARTARHLARDYQFLLAKEGQLHISTIADGLEFSRKQALALPETLLRSELRRLFRPYFQGKNPSSGLIEEALRLLKSSKSKHQELTARGLIFEQRGDRVRLLNFHSQSENF